MMDLYSLNNKSLMGLDRLSFKSEKEIQSMIENNTEELFGVKFIKSEITCNDFRFDTLCFDEENNSFVIIEYKNTKSSSIIDQGYSYLSTMLNNKSDFVLEYNENMNSHLRRDQIDWSQSRIIFISPSFTSYQKNSVNFRDIPFELWEIEKFSNQTIGLQKIFSNSKESIKGIEKGKNNLVSKVSKEVIKYDEESLVTKYSKEFLNIYYPLKEKVLEWDHTSFNVTKNYVSFIKNKSVIFYMNVKKNEFKIDFIYRVDFSGNVKSKAIPFKFKDPENIFIPFENKYKESFSTSYTKNTDLDYLLYCLKQKYDSMK